jgi:hypothetical protein
MGDCGNSAQIAAFDVVLPAGQRLNPVYASESLTASARPSPQYDMSQNNVRRDETSTPLNSFGSQAS